MSNVTPIERSLSGSTEATGLSIPDITVDGEPDLNDPSLYLNRELTWLEFNRRVLYEATDQTNPLLERLKFFAIFASNLDEFFMKRIGGLKIQLAADVKELTVDGRTPEQQIRECKMRVEELIAIRDDAIDGLLQELEEFNIRLLDYSELSDDQQLELRQHYIENVFPLVTPQIFDPAHPFPFISNLSLNILVTLQYGNSEEGAVARVKVPVGAGVPRFVQIGKENHFVALEQIMAHNLDLLFPGEKDLDHDFFFVARNASTEKQESGAADLLALIESELRDRRIAPIVRLVINEGMDPARKSMLVDLLGLDPETDVYESGPLLAQRDLFELVNLDVPGLHYPPHYPITHHRLQDTQRNIFFLIRDAKSMLLQHPYESFVSSVVRFLGEAARDSKVRAIKMTLYRTDEETRIVELLIEAANNGKQVAVVVEIKAKFDEAANIQWAERMEDAGIHVTYGVIGLKTHSKVLMVIRQDLGTLRRYVHIGTGNYHGGAARQYTDLGLLTCDEDIGQDVTELFNYLTTGHARKRHYKSIIVAPLYLKKDLLDRIQREIANAQNGKTGLIQIKSNAMEDEDIVRALYRASNAGVRIELLIRDTCRLRPQVKGLSENITVISVVGRFLEHSRIFYFYNDGAEDYLIGSADVMNRNLESRVEVVTPITRKSLKNELRLILNTLLDDDVDSWEMQPDGSYRRRIRKDSESVGCQHQQIEFAQTRLKTKRHKKLLRTGAQRKRN